MPSLTHAGGVLTRLTVRCGGGPTISSPRARTAGMKVPMRPYRARYARDRVSPLPLDKSGPSGTSREIPPGPCATKCWLRAPGDLSRRSGYLQSSKLGASKSVYLAKRCLARLGFPVRGVAQVRQLSGAPCVHRGQTGKFSPSPDIGLSRTRRSEEISRRCRKR